MLCYAGKVPCVLGLRQDIAAIVQREVVEGAIGSLCKLAHTVVEHHLNCRNDIVLNYLHLSSLNLLRSRLGLEHYRHDAVWHLFVSVADEYGFIIVRQGDWLYVGCVGTSLGLAKDGLDLRFGMVDINIADDDDGLILGVIPLAVVLAKSLVGEVVYDLHRADGESLSVFTAGVHLWQVALEETL